MRFFSFALASAVGLSALACTSTTILAPAPSGSGDGTPDGGASNEEGGPAPGPAPGGSCFTTVTNEGARLPKPSRGRMPSSCTAKELGFVVDPSLGFTAVKAKLSAECAKCTLSEQSEATWGATIRDRADALLNVTACLAAQGEPASCAEAFGIAALCQIDACVKCTDQKSLDACVAAVSSEAGICPNLPRVKAGAATCSPDFKARFDRCSSTEALDYMCGGKDDPLACSSTTQLGASVVGVAGTVVPSFAGGSIANGTYVATKIEGFGAGLGASVVGVASKSTLTITAAGYETISFSAADGATKTSAGTMATAGTKLTQTQSCPSTQTLAESFTATSTTLVLGLGFTAAAPTQGIVVTYTKK